MTIRVALYYFMILLLLGSTNCFSQAALPPKIDSLANKINLYGVKNQSPLLFIHFDKNVYTNNESVWFTAYLLNCADNRPYKTLSLALVRDYDRAVVMEDNFVIKNGFVFGNTTVTNSASPGNYSFIAYTNHLVNGNIDIVFTQPITIKAESQHGFNVSLNPIDTSITAAQKKVLLLVNFPNDSVPPITVPLSYYVGSPFHPVLMGIVRTQAGQHEFNIPANLLSQGNNRLHVQVRYKNDVKDVSMALPVPPRPATVRFYPEGGNLVNNIQSSVGWEVKSAAGIALSVNAVLYEDEKIIDTLLTNSYGIGKFILKPKAGSNYTVRLYGINKQDTLYKLPAAITRGPVIALPHALVNDTLIVNLRDEQHEKLYLIGHNYQKIFFTMPVIMAASTKSVAIKLNELPKGLAQLTVTDSIGRPFAERVFFAHYNRKEAVNISANKNEYAAREKVNIKVKLTGKPDSGFVSISCVQENRIELKKNNDIESYFYLKHDLEDIPVRENYLGNSEADKQYLENALLVKGWRRYTWADMLKTQPDDTIRRYADLIFRGTVTQSKRPLKMPVNIIDRENPKHLIATDSTGNFVLNDTDMITKPDRSLIFIVSGKNPLSYQIHSSSPYIRLNKFLAEQLAPVDYSVPAQENTQYMQLASNEHTIYLKDVNINAVNDSFLGKNICKDYVCPAHFLNCPIDRGNPDNHAPVIGERYTNYVTRVSEIYTGCVVTNESLLLFKGVYAAQEFYPPDLSQVSATEPQYLSTLFWKHQLKISTTKDAEFSFYTGDITGSFKIIIQGVTGNDVVYGEKTFNVVKPKL